MRNLLIASLLLGSVCAQGAQVKHYRARVTFYNGHEDSFRGRTATGTQAKEGRTVAVDFRLIPKGAKVRIPALSGVVGKGQFVAEDTGTAVKSKKASKGMAIVIDVYVRTRDIKNLCRKVPEYMDVEVHFPA